MSRDLIKEAIEAQWGERCPDFDPDCPCCQVWDEFAALEASEDARLLGQAGEKIANLSGEIDRLKRDLARAEAEALERAAEVADQLDANADDIGAAIRALIPEAPAS